MSTSKTLSNGTMSLRFMQRAKDNKQAVQLDKAEVKDDGEWEVSREIREAWGLVGSAGDKTAAHGEGVDKVHEASYIPFLFAKDEEEEEGWAPKTKGRRVFNNKGEDVSFKTPAVQPVASTSTGNITSLSNSAPSNTAGAKPLKTFDRPTSISKTRTKTSGKKPSARDAIFGNGDVGVDMRAQRKSGGEADANAEPVPSVGFMKPAGVDEPKKPIAMKVYDDQMESGIINGARASVKRSVEEVGDAGDKKKKRKKKKSAESLEL